MKYILSSIVLLFFANSISQTISEDDLAPALEDVEQFSEKFYSPGLDALVQSMSNGWINTAKTKDKWKLDISLIGNVTIANPDSRSFLFRESDYNTTRLKSGEPQANVSTILGENNPDVSVLIAVVNPTGGEDLDIELRLPNGIAKTVNFMPTAFIQARLGLDYGFEIKARYLPNLNYQDIEAQFFGFALQNEITKWAKFKEKFPLHLSAFVGYTNFDGFYGFTESDKIEDLDGRISSNANSWLFSAIVSTDYKKLNFYGSIGHVLGNAETTTSTTGIYTLSEPSGDIDAIINIEPYTVETSVSSFRLNLGANYNLGEFNVFADFSLQEFSTASFGFSYNLL